MFAVKDEAVVGQAASIAGDILYNLRAALDHAYWEVVSPFAATPKEQQAIQFPFTETAARLDAVVRSKFADRVSPSFFQAIINLKPHAEPGGNELLYLVHQFNKIDKHRMPIPTADFKKITSKIIQKQVPDFPPGYYNCSFGMNNKDAVWRFNAIPRGDLGENLSADHVLVP